MSPADPIDLAQNLAQTRKYAHLCPGTLQRVAAWAMERHPKTDDALKAAKRKLHQVFASYVSDDVRRWETWLNQVDWKDDAQIKALAEKVLATHASSAERRADCSTVYEQLWKITGTPASLADLGGGVNAFALPWMGLPRTTMYYCTEIDSRMVEAINRWLGGYRQTGEAFCQDLLVDSWTRPVDVAMLLKVAPCLEQQQTGATLKILEGLPARWIVVSFPSLSLGGKAKGMVSHYREQMHQWASQLQRPVQEITLPREIYYLMPGRT